MISKKTNVLTLGAAVLMSIGLASCGGTAAADLTLWVPALDNDVTNTIIENFKTANPDYAGKNIVIKSNIAEGETAGNLTKDKTEAADVFCTADDNLATAVDADCLLDLTSDKASILASDGQDALDAVTVDDKVYGYPYRSDNTYELIYDTTVVSADQAKTLEGIIAACKAAGKKFYYNITDSWYITGYMIANGSTFGVKKVDGVKKIESTFYSSKGVAVAEAMNTLYNSNTDTFVASSEQSAIEAGFGDKTIGACVLWNDVSALQDKNANVTVTKLPTMKIGDVDKQMYSFRGYKAIAVNNNVVDNGHKDLAIAFAKYMAGEASQDLRVSLSYGPSNIKSMAKDAAKALPWFKAITAQGDAFVAQAPNVTSYYWDPVKNFSSLIKSDNHFGTFGSAKKALKNMVNSDGWIDYTFIENA